MSTTNRAPTQRLQTLAALACWALGGLGVWALDGHTDLGSQAMPLVLAAAAASLWWPTPALVLACAVATAAFNWFFVEPRGSLNVTLQRDLLLLLTLWGVSLGVALLLGRQRHLRDQALHQRQRLARLQGLTDQLRLATTTAQHADALRAALADTGLPGAWVALRVQHAQPASQVVFEDLAGNTTGLPDEARSGLVNCTREARAFGPLTGRYEGLPQWYLPLPGLPDAPALGAVLLPLPNGQAPDKVPDGAAAALAEAQGLAQATAQSLQRLLALEAASQAHQVAQAQSLRYTLLAAIAHDHRTPLASILGAASSLRDQADKLSAAQRQRLAAQVVEEAEQLARLTDNALQLARLDSLANPAAALERDWEAPAELVGAVLARVRARDPQHRLRVRLDTPGPQPTATAMPLLRCNAVLVVQLLENLIENALKFSPPGSPVEVLCRALPGQLLLAVRDRGPGVPPGQRDRIFQVFERGVAEAQGRRGAGLGLALCRAVAHAHGGSLRYRARAHGGASLECLLPLETPPQPPATEASDDSDDSEAAP